MPWHTPYWLSLRRAGRGAWKRAWTAALCAVLAFGLVPGGDEVLETVAHLWHDGHLPHSSAHAEVASSEGCRTPDEHGCTPLAHHCKCCAAVAALPPPLLPAWWAARVTGVDRLPATSSRGPRLAGVAPPLPPPIA